MKNYSINLKGRVRNFPLPKNRPLIPLFEAIVNSLHAIEERNKQDEGYINSFIDIEIIRNTEPNLFVGDLAPIEGFIIRDNGIGFNERNMQSFLESDSAYKASIGGKGVGRFTWLKAFSKVEISSIFKEDEIFLKREFEFSLKIPYINDTLVEVPTAKDCLTIISLMSCLNDYKHDMPKQVTTVAMRIMEHCVIYFLDSSCPKIRIIDNEDCIELNNLFKEKFKPEDNSMEFLLDGVNFSLLNVKIEERYFKGNRLYLCANNRLVDSKELDKLIIDLDRQIYERNGFWYLGVLTSEYLDENLDTNRLSFSIPENNNTLFNILTMDKIIRRACSEIETYLETYLSQIKEEKAIRIKKYATREAPQYRHLLKYMAIEIASIKPDLSDDKLDDELYSIKRKFEKNTRLKQKLLLEKIDDNTMSPDEYETYFKKEIERISDANSAVLAEYVAHRKVIIDLFERGLRKNEDGKFNKEEYMHNLIYPMRTTSDDLEYEAHNLWLLDEKLSYCFFISSDVCFDNDPKQDRADLMFLDNPVAISEKQNDGTEYDSIVIFELKRPMRNDYNDTNNPIAQLYRYVSKIRNGEAKDKNHRPIKVGLTTKFYLFAVCDITPKFFYFIDQYGFTASPDKLGYYNFNKSNNSYFEILSYDKILNDAKKRNRILFEKLGV